METHDALFSNDVFVSYSRRDMPFANKLESALKRYQPPRDLKVPQRHLNVFLDTEDFKPGDYDKRLLNHLKDSAKLLVICSPAARDSSYVNDEIRIFGKLRGSDHIVPLLIAGVPNNETNDRNAAQMAFPAALCELMPFPLAASYVSFDPQRDQIHRGVFIQSWYTVLAGIYDVSRSEIEQREYKRRIRSRRMIYSLVTLFALLIVTVMAALLLQTESSSNALLDVESRYQSQLVQNKARQIELYGQRYRDIVVGLARAFEISGGLQPRNDEGYDRRLQVTLQDDPNLIALALWPVNGNLKRAFQPDVIKLEEVDARVNEVLKYMNGHEVVVSRPEIIRSGQEMALTIAGPVFGNRNEVIGHVIAVVSFQEIFDTVSPMISTSEQELLDAGLPVVFVVDKNGRAVAHPEAKVTFSERPMTDLKVVQDWLGSGAQVQSALTSFSTLRDGQKVEMLGSYATAELDANLRLGVIAIQDKAAALQSVDEMRWRGRALAFVAVSLVVSQIGLAFLLKLFYYDMRYSSRHKPWNGTAGKRLREPSR